MTGAGPPAPRSTRWGCAHSPTLCSGRCCTTTGTTRRRCSASPGGLRRSGGRRSRARGGDADRRAAEDGANHARRSAARRLSGGVRRSRNRCGEGRRHLAAAAALARPPGELLRRGSRIEPRVRSVHAGRAGDGRAIAAKLGIADFAANNLYRPKISLQFGASYLASQLAAFGGVRTARSRRTTRGRARRRMRRMPPVATTTCSSKSWSSTKRGYTCGS